MDIDKLVQILGEEEPTKTEAEQDDEIEGLLESLAPDSATRALDLGNVINLAVQTAAGAKQSSESAEPEKSGLTELLGSTTVKENLTKILEEKFKLPKLLAELLADAILKKITEKKKARKKTSSSKRKTTARKTTKKTKKTVQSPRKKTTKSARKTTKKKAATPRKKTTAKKTTSTK